jgi:putative transposase
VAQTLGNVVVHLIFSTKQRKPLIEPDIRSSLFAYLGGIVRELRGTALIVNGTCDHVHMLIRIRPAHSIADIARIVKTNSSGWIRKGDHKEFGWQAGYGAFSVRESNIPRSYQIHRNAGRTPQKAFLPGRICGISEKE